MISGGYKHAASREDRTGRVYETCLLKTGRAHSQSALFDIWKHIFMKIGQVERVKQASPCLTHSIANRNKIPHGNLFSLSK